jgi:hypothetical protein
MRGQKVSLRALLQRLELSALDAHFNASKRNLHWTQLLIWCFVLARHCNARRPNARTLHKCVIAHAVLNARQAQAPASA